MIIKDELLFYISKRMLCEDISLPESYIGIQV